MMNKKWIALLLVLALVLSLTACGANEVKNSVEPSADPTQVVSENVEDSAGDVVSYTYEYMGMMAESTLQMDFAEDGTLEFYLVKDPMIKDVFIATYVREGDIITISGVENTNPDALVTSPTVLWNWIVDGCATIKVDDASGTFEPVVEEDDGDDGDLPAPDGDLPPLDGDLPALDGDLPPLDGNLPG